MKRSFALCLAGLFLLAACKDITHVQTGYISDRDECRGNAENNVGVYSQPEAYGLNDREKNTALLQLFCECMKGKDWKVAGCPKPAVAVAAAPAPQQPTVVVVQSPTAQPGFVAEQPQPVYSPVAMPVPVKGKKKKRVCMAPVSVCEAPADPASPKSGAYSPTTPASGPGDLEDRQLNGILGRQ